MAESNWPGNPVLAILAGKEEDRFTEFLVHLLQAPEVLRAFLKDACGLDVTDAMLNSLHVRTQVTVAGGRPDIAIQSPDLYFLFEAKVGSWLHEDQLAPYAAALQDWSAAHPDGKARLFMLAPGRNLRELRQTVQRQLGNAEAAHILKWEEVAETLRRVAEQVHSPRLRVYLQDFKELVTYRLGENTRPFTEEETRLLADPLVASALRAARQLVGRIAAVLHEEHGGEIDVGRPVYGPGWDGYTLRSKGRWWWFGLWLDAWVTAGESCIVLQVPGFRPDKLPAEFTHPLQYWTLRGEKGWVVPMILRGRVDPEELAREHAAEVYAWVTKFPESGGLHSPMPEV
ncbi:PD-(D/E)XK nuclease family protein [Myxococcus sp. RHSTA-1-4]|uniref:PD-(D/E)XK nuclease family protein n=1 Tax=Myxococcus sp. RHSTA-1-4 TaxID=2874601 RepID=UPI001CC0FA0D|nr:PD-(D/E)XK nuclease family protein [Myxococcus sp. RHSTA-1-4]MBZ4419335.1 PD-(D/E)XK nuclease family protein [Myxococcus sp. RHSTA-1-4]